MYFLNANKTQKCDILLTTTLAWTSRLICRATESDISHASLMVDSHALIDSTGDGVQARNIHRIEYEDKCSIHLMRFKGTLSDEQKNKIESFARDKIGMRYNTTEAIKSGFVQHRILSPKDDGQRMFCSRLVAKAYEFAGIKLVENPQYCTPEDLKKSPLLCEITDIAIPVPYDISSLKIQGLPNFDERMRDVTNDLLSRIRKLDDSVETLTDIVDFLFKHPEKDGDVLCAYQESGFLTLEDAIFAQTSYLYNSALFMVHYMYGNIEIQAKIGADEDTSRFDNNLEIYKNMYDQTKLKTFEALVNLYEKLVEHSELRKKTCREVLRSLDKAPAFKRVMGLG